MWKLFHTTYLAPACEGPYALDGWTTRQVGAEHEFTANVDSPTGRTPVRGRGNGPLAALTDALREVGVHVDILGYTEHATTSGPDATAAAYAHCRVNGHKVWGAGLDSSILAAGVQAVMTAANRALAQPA